MTAQPTPTKSSSRRALLAGALGGLGAWAASAIGRASPVQAGTDGDVVLGSVNLTTGTTEIRNPTNDSHVFVGWSEGHAGTGVYGASSGGNGVRGQSDSANGVLGTSVDGVGVLGSTGSTVGQAKGVHGVVSSPNPGPFSAGVRGENSGTGGNGTGVYGTHDGSGWGVYGYAPMGVGVYGHNAASDQPAIRGLSAGNGTGVLGTSGASPAPKPKTGVYGYANQDSSAKGVWGFSGKGVGVYGQANKAGYAIRSRGRVKFEKVSGVATIQAGNTSVAVSPANVKVTSSSFVLLTPKANIGSRRLWFTTNPNADSITIHISSTRASATKIAWLLLG